VGQDKNGLQHLNQCENSVQTVDSSPGSHHFLKMQNFISVLMRTLCLLSEPDSNADSNAVICF
jgi:hypothetical protein